MGLNIIACVKSVINNTLPSSNRNTLENMELNPFDKPAIEMALSLIKEHKGTLTVLSMGPKSATLGIHQAIAMGADRAILICDTALKESDTYITAKVLGKALKKLEPFDIVLFGTRTSDSDTGHVGPQTAQMLDIPFIGNIHSLTPDYVKNIWTAERKADGYLETFEIVGQNKHFPKNVGVNNAGVADIADTGMAFSVSSAFGYSAFGESSFISLYGVERAFSDKNIEFWDNQTLGLKPEETGLIASPTKIVAWNKEKRAKKCQFIDGTYDQKAEQLAQKLSEAGFVG
ncbi:MAG: electron transfer flavoprotein subunit beta/FixA family protein [Desulfamplus sp.]|nr:electron transfer flavoprotein subunit beta/FixA family protein [Desulfamplus sp.]